VGYVNVDGIAHAACWWEDIDLSRGMVSVRRTMARLADGQVEFTEPKTGRGRRVIPLPASAVNTRRVHRQQQLEERLASGGEWKDADLVFANADGGPVDLANLRNRDLRGIARRALMPRGHFSRCGVCTQEKWLSGAKLCKEGEALRRDVNSITLYSLRHTVASVLLAGGVHVKAVSERLGHASTAFTMDTYVHSLPTVQEQAAAKLEELFTSAKP
jgi:integrase